MSFTSFEASGRLPAGMLKFGVRWNTVRWAACSAMTGIDWMPDEPVPMTPTRMPVKSTPSCGQWPVWYVGPGEALDARDLGQLRMRQAPRRHDVVLRRDRLALRGGDRPAARGVVPHRLVDAGLELDVLAEVEAVGHVVRVLQDLGLRRVPLAPGPFLLELLVEGERVVQALDVAARARIPVPVPRAAHAVAASITLAEKPSLRSWYSMYMPAKPAPTITASCTDARLIRCRSSFQQPRVPCHLPPGLHQ